MEFSQRKVGIIFSYANIALKTIINLIYTPIMLRLLGKSEYGIYSLCMSFISYLSLLNMGFSITYVRYYTQLKERKGNTSVSKLNGMFLCIFLFIAFLVLIFGTILIVNAKDVLGSKITSSEYHLTKVLMTLMVINLSFTMVGSVFNSLITANERYFFQQLLLIIGTISSPIVTLPLLIFGAGSIGLVCVTTIINFITVIVNAVYCLRNLRIKFEFGDFDFVLIKDMGGFTFFIFLQSIMDQLNWEIGKFLLARFQGSAAIAIYTVGAQLNSYYMVMSCAISSVFTPQINRMVANQSTNEEISNLFIRISRIQFIVVAFILTYFIFFGRFFIRFWAGNGYDNSYYVALLLMIPITIALTQGLGLDILRAKKKHAWQMVINLGTCILNLLISIPLCKRYAEIGTAFGTFIGTFLIVVIIQNIYFYRVGEIDIPRYAKEMFDFSKSLIIPLVLGIMLAFYVHMNNFFLYAFTSMIYFGVYAISIWKFGMNDYEKGLFLKPAMKLLRRNEQWDIT